ncbi:MAG TPA: ribonuclease P protein component [Geobacteraceae bacterium]
MPGFPKHERLLHRSDFVRISGQGEKIHSANFIILWERASGETVRVGITVSGKVGNAVVRNRLKRLIREFYRLNKALFAPADYNIIAKKGAASLDFSALSQELGRVLQRLVGHPC